MFLSPPPKYNLFSLYYITCVCVFQGSNQQFYSSVTGMMTPMMPMNYNDASMTQ